MTAVALLTLRAAGTHTGLPIAHLHRVKLSDERGVAPSRFISSPGGCCGPCADCVTGRYGVEAERTFSQVDDPSVAPSGETSKSKYMVLVSIGCSETHELTFKGEIGGASYILEKYRPPTRMTCLTFAGWGLFAEVDAQTWATSSV